MEICDKESPLTPPAVTFNHGYTKLKNSRRTPRKLKQPRKTPAHCRDSSYSVVLQFQLINGTSTPSLQIRTSGSHQYIVRARRRLFNHDSSWSKIKEECKTIQYEEHRAQDSAPESGEETDLQETISTDADSKSKYKVKICASCKTKKTPLWRDAEDGTPYCNACGIRFKKYRVCCPVCSYIPRKDEKFGNTCCQCGSTLFHYNRMWWYMCIHVQQWFYCH